MAKTKEETLLIEAMKNLLERNEVGKSDSLHSHHMQFQWEDIQDEFSLAIKDSDFFESLRAAFYKVHSYKWINDSTFEDALISDLESMGIPHDEIELALNALEKVRKKFIPGKENESGAGWPENIKYINNEFDDTEVTDTSKDTFSGNNKPYTGSEPDNTRPVPSKI
jgi:hypothetical protein